LLLLLLLFVVVSRDLEIELFLFFVDGHFAFYQKMRRVLAGGGQYEPL
jgi:hypothetical protein